MNTIPASASTPCIVRPPLTDTCGDAGLTVNVVGTVGTVGGYNGEVAPVAGASLFSNVTRHFLVIAPWLAVSGDIAPATQ